MSMLYPGQSITIKSAPAEVEAGIFVQEDGAIAGAGEIAVGVSINKTAQYDALGVYISGIVSVQAGGSITAGDEIVADANGKAVSATALSVTVPTAATPVTSDAAQPTLVVAGSALPEKVLGIAMEDGSDGNTIAVKLR